MAVANGFGKVVTSGSVFMYDTGDTVNSYIGEPTVNYVPGTYAYGLYAYASGPVNTTVFNEKNESVSVKRYTITQAANTARAAIRPSGLTTGVAYTFSFKWRYNGSTTASPSVGINASKGNPEGGANNNSFTSAIGNTVNIGNGWYLSTYTFIFSSVPTGKCILTFGINTGNTAGYVGETFDIYEAQFEIKDHRTQFTTGTRSATQGLLPIVGGSSMDLSNVSFDSNAQILFDGTDDYIITSNMPAMSNWTTETIINLSNYTTSQKVILDVNLGIRFEINNGYFNSHFGNGSGWIYTNLPSTFTYTANTTYHIVVTVQSGGQAKMYINGILNNSTNIGSGTTPSVPLYIGRFTGASGYEIAGTLPVVKIYDRALSSSEVKQNYNKYKTRFNLS